MKLDECLEEQINKYFDNISAEELYATLKEKYDFEDDDTLLAQDSENVYQRTIRKGLLV